MIELYQAGLSTNCVSKLTGWARGTVRDALGRRGVTLRPVHQRGPANKMWIGRCENRGYVYIRLPDDHPLRIMGGKQGRTGEHRIVMAQALGRSLRKHEHVHHINGVRNDNRIENLQLVSTGHPAGVRMRCITCGSHHVEPVAMGDTA